MVCASHPQKTTEITMGASHFYLELPPSLESDRHALEQNFTTGYKIIADFAIANKWSQHFKDSYIDRAVIFDSKREFDSLAIKLTEAPKDFKMPSTFTGGLEKKVFFAASPQLITKVTPKLVEDKFFAKLIAHEIAHRLHIRILNGNEDAMGPIWFFEGFAVVASGQYSDYKITEEQIWEVVNSKTRGDYRAYGASLRYFLNKASMEELLRHASKDDFISWLERLDQ